MKNRIAAFLLAMALLVVLMAPLAPQAQAATVSSYEPNASISYDYSPITVAGTIRYIAQKPGSSKFDSRYWGKYVDRASYNCSTSCISMALSYIGIDQTPEAILDYNIQTVFMAKYGGSTPKSYTYDKLSTAMDNYVGGNGKYSPPVIHLDKYSTDGHYVMLIGRVAANQYQVLDPANLSIWTITINGSTATYSLGSGTITDTIDNVGTEDVYQWYNPNAALMEVVRVKNGQTAKVSVSADGDNLTYTWYYANKGESTFQKADSATTATYSVVMSDSVAGRKVYCKITDKNNNSFTTDKVLLDQIPTLAITTQPKNAQAPVGSNANVTVEANGEGLTYTWYYAKKGENTFKKDTSCTTKTYSLTMSEANDGRRVYCVVADKYGDSVTTDIATISVGTATSNTNATVKVTSVLCIRSGAGTSYGIVGSYRNGEKIEILEKKTVGSDVWGKTAKGWVYMAYVKMDNDSSSVVAANATVKVTSVLCIRSGAGTGYGIVGSYGNGVRIAILEKKTVGSTVWGRTSKGWVSMAYVTMDDDSSSSGGTSSGGTSSGSTTTTQPNATVKVTSVLCIRSGAGTGYGIVDSYKNGTRIAILEEKTVGSDVWGKTAKGWVSMKYVVKDGSSSSGGTSSGGTSSGGTSSGSTTTTQPNATVKVTSVLCIRSGAGTSYGIQGSYGNGERIAILEEKTVGSDVWGKTAKGWVSMKYVVKDGSSSSSGSSSSGGSTSGGTSSGGSTSGGTSSGSTTTSKPNATIKTSSGLKIRSGAGSSYSVVGYYYSGARVEILEKKTVGSDVWGKTAKGWVSMAYVKMDSDSSSSGSTGSTNTSVKTVDTTCLLVRDSASTSGKIVGYLYKGDKVTITETKTAGGYNWGKTSKGWIALKFTK